MNRRQFVIHGLVAAVSVPVLRQLRRRAAESLPTLYGDGTTDDTPAFRAMFAGRPYYDLRRRLVVHALGNNPHVLAGGIFAIDGTLEIPEHLDVEIGNTEFKAL